MTATPTKRREEKGEGTVTRHSGLGGEPPPRTATKATERAGHEGRERSRTNDDSLDAIDRTSIGGRHHQDRDDTIESGSKGGGWTRRRHHEEQGAERLPARTRRPERGAERTATSSTHSSGRRTAGDNQGPTATPSREQGARRRHNEGRGNARHQDPSRRRREAPNERRQVHELR